MTPLEAAHEAHQQAMELAEAAFLAERRGGQDAKAIYRQAFLKEREAAIALASSVDVEPTRSVFYRSAATLALRCGELHAAERLAAQGLAGEPPEEIADELRTVMEEISFARHLEVKGIVLEPTSFQMSLWGGAVSPGRVAGHEFSTRYQDTERLVYRTAERKLKKPFRENITSSKSFRKNLEIFMSVPRAASFAVTVTVGMVEQAFLPELQDHSPGAVVIQELLSCVELFNLRKDDQLKERIGNDAYYYNFIGLMGRIAPDGDKIKGVGFTAVEQGKPVSVGLTRRQDDPPVNMPKGRETKRSKEKEYGEVHGVLDIKDSVTVKTDDGKVYRVIVPDGLMGDVVRPLGEHRVVVRGQRKGKVIVLEGIVEAK